MQAEPTTLAALVTSTGLHANTVREHLDALEGDGLVRRHRSRPTGRGRPAWRYEATDATGVSEYAGLSAALAGAVHSSSQHPEMTARLAGNAWGHELARVHGAPPRPTPAAARREVVALLGEFGFEPEADARHHKVRLTRCPLLEAAHRAPDIVCSVHLGLVDGALEEYGAQPDGTALVPFAEPGACLLHLRTRSTGPRP